MIFFKNFIQRFGVEDGRFVRKSEEIELSTKLLLKGVLCKMIRNVTGF
jgi:hypothetical protein